MKIAKVYSGILFLLILVILGKSNNAQKVFQKNYLGSNTCIGYSIQADSSGFVIAGATSGSGQGGMDVLVMKTDLNGNILWAETIGGKGDDIARSIKKTSDGGFIIAGSTSSYVNPSTDSSNFYIIKTDNSGNVQWTRAIGSYDAEVANDVIETYDHKYVILGSTKSVGPGNGDIYLMELSSAGDLQWSYGMGSTGTDFGNSLIQTSSHDFIIVGSTTGYNSQGQVPYIIFTSESGIVQNPSGTFNFNSSVSTSKRYFTKIIDGYFNDYVLTGSDGLGSFGDAQHFLLDLDQNCDVNWMKKYFMNSGECVGTSLDKTPQGGYIIGGTMGIDIPALIKTDAIGQLEAMMIYPDMGFSYFGKGFDVKQTNDGADVLVGYRYNSSDTSVYLVKADFNLSTGCEGGYNLMNYSTPMYPTISIQNTTYATGSNYIAIDSGIVAPAYPFMNVICLTTGTIQNPLINENLEIRQSDISIEFLLKDQDDFIKLVTIYNLLGDKVISIDKNIQGVSTTGLSNGIYFYQVLTNHQQFFTGKFIISRSAACSP